MKKSLYLRNKLLAQIALFLILSLAYASLPGIVKAQTPGISGFSLNSTSGNNTNDDDLVSSYIFTGSAVTAATAWFKNGAPLMTLYLPFEGGSINGIKDYSGNNYTVTSSGSPVWSVTAGHDGFGAYTFDGASYLNAGKIFPTKSSYTQCAWIYRTISGTYNCIIGGRDQTSSSGHGLRIKFDGCLSAGQNGNLNLVQGYAGTITTNRWYFAVVTFDYVTGAMILYQDGQPIDTAVVPAGSRIVLDSTVQIGAIAGGTDWRGQIDDARIYNFVLSPDQIKTLYTLHGGDKIVAVENQVGETWQARVTPFSPSAAGITNLSNIITIVSTAPTFTSSPVTAGIAGKLYSYAAHATGGPTPTYQLSLYPPGMTIDSMTGVIRWIAGISGIYSIMISAVNAIGTTNQSFSLNIAAPTVSINNLTLSTTANDTLICLYNIGLQATTSATAWYKNGAPIMTLYMPFEGGPSYALDDASGNNNPMLPIGNPVWAANGGHDGYGAFVFDGSSFIIAGNIFPTRSSYTKTAWIFHTATGEYDHILSGWDHSTIATGGHGLRVASDQRLSAGQNGNWRIVQTDAGAIVSNHWYFAAVTFNYSTGEMILYLDGVAVNSAIVPTTLRDVTDPGLLIGATQGAFGWKGKIDDPRVYNYPLTPQQIAAMFNSGGNNRIVAQETHVGEIWHARVTPFSATEAGTPYQSNLIAIGNLPPVLAAIGPKSIAEAQNLNFNISATDPDGTTPTLTTSSLPANATFVDHGNGTGTFNFNPNFTQAGAYNITFVASDGSLADTEIVTVTVTNVNRPPVLAAIGAKDAIVGNTLTFLVTASDPDNELIILSALSLPFNSSFIDHSNDTGIFSFTPSVSQAGIYNVKFKATDPHAAGDSLIVPITVVDNTVPANWMATITVTGELVGSASNSDKVIIGTSDSDRVSYSPPQPPEYTSSIRLLRSGLDGPYSKVLQKSGNKCYFWTIEVDPHGNATPPTPARCATISWNPTELNSNRHYVLHEGLDPNGPVILPDMRATTQYQVCDIQTPHYYTVHWEDDSCSGKTYAEIPLNAGWNLISLPILPIDSALSSLFPTAQIAYEYNGQYLETSRLTPGKGYWVKVPSATTATIVGQPVNSYSSALPSGWNLMGAANCTATPQTTPTGLLSVIFDFNGSYQSATQLSAGLGYWIKANAACNINLTCGAPKELSSNYPQKVQSLTIRARNSNSDAVSESDVIIGVGSHDEMYSAPPDAPQYSVKLELYREGWDGPYFEDIHADTGVDNTWIIALNSRGNIFPRGDADIILSWNPEEMGDGLYQLHEGFVLGGAVLLDDMHSIKEYRVKQSDSIQFYTVIRKSATANLPNTFRLENNFPNPFNPATTIEYSLQNHADVKLSIFNMLGQKVKELVNESQAAGIHRVIWDGTDAYGNVVSTGIYLYRMQVGDLAETRKMVLIK